MYIIIAALQLRTKWKVGFLLNFWKSCDILELWRGILFTSSRTATQTDNKGRLLALIMQREKNESVLQHHSSKAFVCALLFSIHQAHFPMLVNSILSCCRCFSVRLTSTTRLIASEPSNSSEKRRRLFQKSTCQFHGEDSYGPG